mgnify:CR=1 FL=1
MPEAKKHILVVDDDTQPIPQLPFMFQQIVKILYGKMVCLLRKQKAF